LPAVSACRELSFIEAPVDSVWGLVGDPRRFPEWWPRVVEVRGEEFAEGTEYVQVTRGPMGSSETTNFRLDVLDEQMHEVRMHCQLSGYYAHWRLTEGQGGTFTEVEFGVDPQRPGDRVFDAVLGKMYMRRWLNQSLQALRSVVSPV
jgi:uncharacterized protein YndB with AHSA1/START domain